ncbi:hypothetical protein HAX54_046418 [Datura stramonium]|uniref:Uncharacterized protein n=1 Tax=Datura stramonium TaxID=4076 RepID=A0ABS8SRI5_DATST|nr:hypothetical protein [Datura stramonium]
MDTGKEDNDKRDLIDITKYAKPQDDTPLGEWKEVKRRKQKRINNNQKEKQESIKERIQHEQAAPVTQNSFDELLEEFEIQDKATIKGNAIPEDYNKGDGNKEQGGKEEDEWADTNSSEDDISEESTNKGKVENNTPGVSNKSEQAEEQTENNTVTKAWKRNRQCDSKDCVQGDEQQNGDDHSEGSFLLNQSGFVKERSIGVISLSMVMHINGITIKSSNLLDQPIWTPNTDGRFSCKSAWNSIREHHFTNKMIQYRGHSLKVSFFTWKLFKHKIVIDLNMEKGLELTCLPCALVVKQHQ